MPRLVLLITALLMVAGGISAQDQTDSLAITSYIRGKNLVGMAGAVSSFILDRSQFSVNPSDLGNNYNFEVKLGKFVYDKNLVGLSFMAARSHLISYIETIAEMLSVGPWYRLYASCHGIPFGTLNMITVNDEVLAIGMDGSLGLGVSYAIGGIIAFEVGCDFHQGRFWGSLTDNMEALGQDVVLVRCKFMFSFGFAVLFGKLRE